VCAVPKLFLIEALEEGEETQGKVEAAGEEDPGEFFLEEFPEISLNAITGTPSPKTMRIVGFLRLHQVVILIDSGSCHIGNSATATGRNSGANSQWAGNSEPRPK
jgi:hypothetical protein